LFWNHVPNLEKLMDKLSVLTKL